MIAKFLTEKRSDQTRLEIERLRAEASAARAAARSTKADEANAKAKEEEEWRPWTEEENRQWDETFRRSQENHALTVSRNQLLVHLWGGCHKLGDTLPDETDIPLMILSDMTVAGKRIYWATTYPMPTNTQTGPFLPKPGKPLG